MKCVPDKQESLSMRIDFPAITRCLLEAQADLIINKAWPKQQFGVLEEWFTPLTPPLIKNDSAKLFFSINQKFTRLYSENVAWYIKEKPTTG